MTRRPTARNTYSVSENYKIIAGFLCVPMGTETPTNFPLCRAGPVLGTKLPRMIPIAMARKIHIAKNRSRIPRLENMDSFFCGSSGEEVSRCFSMSHVFIWSLGGLDVHVCGRIDVMASDQVCSVNG